MRARGAGPGELATLQAGQDIIGDATSLPVLAEQINSHHALAVKSAESAIEHALEAGRLLLQAKEQIGHGGWLEWIFSNCEVSARQCQKYMRLAANANRGTHLTSIRAALAELAAPKPPRAPKPTLPPPEIPIHVQSGCLTVGWLDGEPTILFEESRRHPGYWYCHDARNWTVNTRPIRADAAGWLLSGVPDAGQCEWHLVAGSAECFAEHEAE